jgi:hypothetical protein
LLHRVTTVGRNRQGRKSIKKIKSNVQNTG